MAHGRSKRVRPARESSPVDRESGEGSIRRGEGARVLGPAKYIEGKLDEGPTATRSDKEGGSIDGGRTWWQQWWLRGVGFLRESRTT